MSVLFLDNSTPLLIIIQLPLKTNVSESPGFRFHLYGDIIRSQMRLIVVVSLGGGGGVGKLYLLSCCCQLRRAL